MNKENSDYINHILCLNYNHSFPQNLNHWLLEKSEEINLQMLIHGE